MAPRQRRRTRPSRLLTMQMATPQTRIVTRATCSILLAALSVDRTSKRSAFFCPNSACAAFCAAAASSTSCLRTHRSTTCHDLKIRNACDRRRCVFLFCSDCLPLIPALLKLPTKIRTKRSRLQNSRLMYNEIQDIKWCYRAVNKAER